MRTILGLLLATACGPADDTTSTDTSTDSGTTPSTTDTDDPPSTDGCSARVAGSARDGADVGMADVDLRFCKGTQCRTGTTDGSGGFEFLNICAGSYSLEFTSPPGSGLATSLTIVDIEDFETMVLDGVMLPLDDAATLGTAAALTLGAGLHVTVGLTDLTPPDAVSPDPTTAAGVALPDPSKLFVEGATTVAAAWYTSPFDYSAAAGLPTEIDNLWGLEEGSTWHVWVASYTDSAWLDAGTLTVTGGNLVGTVSLPLLATVALVQP